MKTALTLTVLLWQAAAFAQAGRGVVTGQLRGVDGKPAVGVRVTAMAVPESGPSGTSLMASIAETDAAGRYRLEDIPPGRYFIAAGKLDGPTFFPGVKAVSNAKPIAITSGAVISGTDFTIRLPVRVSGRVEGLKPGEPGRRLSLVESQLSFASRRDPLALLVPLPQLADSVESGAVLSAALTQEQAERALSQSVRGSLKPDGAFEFSDVAPGAYVIWIVTGPSMPDLMEISGGKRIVVGEHDVTGVVTALPRRVVGRVIVDQSGPVPPFVVSFTGSAGLSGIAIATAPTFEASLQPGVYQVQIKGLAAGYFPRRILYGATDVLHGPMVVGEDGSGLVIQLGVSSPPPWVRVSGHFKGWSPNESGWVFTLSDSVNETLYASRLNPDGAFDFDRILPGTYVASIIPREVSHLAPQLAGMMALDGITSTFYSLSIVVGASDLRGLEIQLPSRVTVSGQLSVEHNAALPRGARVTLTPTSPEQINAPLHIRQFMTGVAVSGDGTFQTVVPEGEYRLTVAGLDPSYQLRSMTDGSGDLIDGALRVSGQAPRDLSIVFSIPTFAVTGRAQYSALRENASDPVPVVLSGPGLAFDLETQLQAGAFEFPHVPSGDYTLQLGPGAMPVRFRVAETDVRMEMEITSIRGRVLFPAGSAAPAIVLSLSPSGAPDATVYVRPNVSADGAFTLPIPVGSYSASIAGYLPGYTLSVNNGGDLLQAGQTFAVSRENAVELQVVSGQ